MSVISYDNFKIFTYYFAAFLLCQINIQWNFYCHFLSVCIVGIRNHFSYHI